VEVVQPVDAVQVVQVVQPVGGGGGKGEAAQVVGRFLGRAVRFFFEQKTPGLRKCGFHQNSTPASSISTRYRVGLGGVAFVPPGAICALPSGPGAV
jgi:hypothetical protein